MVSQTLCVGGAERVTLRLANHWANVNRNVVLVLIRAEGAFMSRLDSRVCTISLDSRKSIYASLGLWKFLRLHPETPVLLFGLEVARVAALGKRLGIVANRLIYREASNPYANKSFIGRFSYRWLLDKVDRVVVQNRTADLALHALGLCSATFATIPNPVEATATRQRPMPYETSPNGPRLVAIGRLVPVKGFVRLIEAMPYVHSRFPGARLVIYGEGPMRGELERLISRLKLSDCVSLPGFIVNIEAIWVSSDVFVLSSFFEGQPNALLEAFSHGVRVVATPAGGGVRELLDVLKLQDCQIHDERFSAGLVSALSNALYLPLGRWKAAADQFHQVFSPDRCYGAYTKACLSDVLD
jgi:glycosyltransferase involved in cell wall biosynthesis